MQCNTSTHVRTRIGIHGKQLTRAERFQIKVVVVIPVVTPDTMGRVIRALEDVALGAVKGQKIKLENKINFAFLIFFFVSFL